MSRFGLSQPPKGYQPPSTMPRVSLAYVAALLPRLRCGTCKAQLKVDPPTLEDGRLYCLDCGRDYWSIAAKVSERLQWVPEPERPKRGRPPKPMPISGGAR